MPPIDDEFIRTLARTVIDLLAAVERAEKLAVIAALNVLLSTIVDHGTAKTREAEVLARAIERV